MSPTPRFNSPCRAVTLAKAGVFVLCLLTSGILCAQTSGGTHPISGGDGGGDTIQPAPITPGNGGDTIQPAPTPISGDPPPVTIQTARTWNSLGTDWNTSANWTGGAPVASGAVGVFTTVESVQPNLSASVSIAGILFQGVGTFNYDITRTNNAVFTLLGTDPTGSGGTSNSTAAALRGENTSGTNTIDVPIILGAASGSQTFFQAPSGTLVVNGAISSTNTVGLTINSSGAGGVVQLTGTNTYSGNTTITGGATLKISAIGIAGASGNIGTGTTINFGGGSGSGTLLYTGTGETTDRVINLAGTTGGATIDQSGTGLLKFTGTNTATGNGTKTLTLQGSTAGTGEISGTIVNSTSATSLTKTGTGKWTLSGNNSFTGTTTVSGGTLEANGTAGNKALGGTTNIILNPGGTLLTSSAQQFNATTPPTISLSGGKLNTAGTSQTLGALTLTANSTIDMGTGASILNFGGTSTRTAGILTIDNWSGNKDTGAGTDQIIFANQLPQTFLDNINFTGFSPGAIELGTGEIVPVPEPSTWIAAGLAFAALGYSQRKRLSRLLIRA
ncbi:MAG: hypothetical protein QOI04_1117 [Verrucomicrobiota bacterium]|jgi:autotransporter-associated beta strand protein